MIIYQIKINMSCKSKFIMIVIFSFLFDAAGYGMDQYN